MWTGLALFASLLSLSLSDHPRCDFALRVERPSGEIIYVDATDLIAVVPAQTFVDRHTNVTLKTIPPTLYIKKEVTFIRIEIKDYDDAFNKLQDYLACEMRKAYQEEQKME